MNYPQLTLKENVKVVDGTFRIILPDGSMDVEKFTMRSYAQPRLNVLNEERRKKGGRPPKDIEFEWTPKIEG